MIQFVKFYLSKLACSIFLVIVINELNAQDLSEKIFSGTIKINGYKDLERKELNSGGTGFFISMAIEKDTFSFIVTNAHVIKDCKLGVIKFNTVLDSKVNYGDIITVNISNFEELWIIHPTEDLAILPLVPIASSVFKKYNKSISVVSFTEKEMLTTENENELSAIEDVIMVGYPKGLSDTTNNLPIVRKGTTATPIYLNYNKSKHFLLDIPIYPGSSGSPIIQFNNSGMYFSKKDKAILPGERIRLLGIAVKSKDYLATGETKEISGKKIKTTTWLPYGIADIIKAYVLFDFKPAVKKYIKDVFISEKWSKSLSFSYKNE